jgi:hypothetical protein
MLLSNICHCLIRDGKAAEKMGESEDLPGKKRILSPRVLGKVA